MNGRERYVECLSDNALRALVDGAASETDSRAWSAHLATCGSCRVRLKQMRIDADRAASLMDRLAPSGDEMPDTSVAYRRLRARAQVAQTEQRFWLKGASFMNRLFGAPRRAAMVGVAVVALMVAVIVAAPVGTLAENFINSLRVHQFAAVTIPMDFMQQMDPSAHAMTPQDMSSFLKGAEGAGTKNFSTTLGPNSIHQAASIDEAKSHLGGSIEVPTNLPDQFAGVQPKIMTGDAGNASYTLDVAQAQQMLQRLSLNVQGLPDPAVTPKVTFSVDVPASALFDYQSGDQHLVVGQMASPTLNIPAGVDINQLRDTILSIPGLPTDLVAQLKAVNDWEHTLIVPVPAGATTSQKTVDGAPALLISFDQGAVVLWQKDGNLYGVGGTGLTGDQVMSVAKSMQAQ